MKNIDLSKYRCPNCSDVGSVYVFTPVDSNFKAVKCGTCLWWTWLKNLNKAKLIVIDESSDLPEEIWK